VKTELELRHLRVFVTLVEAGAHTRAARALGVSQSTVSETMSALERTLGTPLFRKAGKGAMLTPSGEALLPYAQKILALSGELVTELAKVSTDVSATLVVTAVESLCTYVLPSRLAILRERWPKARLEVIPGACADIRASVAAGKSDLGLTLGAEADDDDGLILAKGRLVIVCSPSHPLAGSVASAEQLRAFDFYMCDAAGDYHQMLRKHFEAAQFPPPRMQALGTVEGVKRGIVVGGTAVGLLPAHAIVDELRDGALAEIAVTPQFPGLALRSVMRGGAMTSPLVEALVESLRDSPLLAG
jgi:DNA-binding transcriptional LysR family regulator